MNVLMFGWEFPPHISGGLGTACYGLTQSLVRENVNLTFVVPKLHGNEPSEKMTLISASKVFVPFAIHQKKIILKKIIRNREVRQIEEKASVAGKSKSTGSIARVEVEALLDPYGIATVHEQSYPVEHWNYILDAPQTKMIIEEKTKEGTVEEAIPSSGYTYDFSGAYGGKLMEEVQQYALVGAELAKAHRHDVIHAHDWMTFGAGIEAKKASGKPFVIHVHATEFDRSGTLGGPVFECEKKGMEAADRIIAVSQWTKDILVSKYGIPSDKVEVVHNGVIACDDEVTTPAIPPVGSHVVTFLGRVTHQKGPRYFVEAAKKVAGRFPEAHFIIAGAGDLLPQTIERVAQMKMSDKFHFTGFLNKEWISRIWSMSSVYVMPSVSEPFGITPLEAIQAGVPVILSNQSGVAEVMPHALKVNFWDIDALAESICSVLKYKSLSTMLKTRGEKEIRNLSWEKAAVKLKSLYEELAT